jgi:hypothetical protein
MSGKNSLTRAVSARLVQFRRIEKTFHKLERGAHQVININIGALKTAQSISGSCYVTPAGTKKTGKLIA